MHGRRATFGTSTNAVCVKSGGCSAVFSCSAAFKRVSRQRE